MTVEGGDVAELRIGDLLTFLAVARSSSLTAAARERNVTPSQVSKAITRVEQHFGKKLLDRGSRGVVLSEAGKRLRPTLETILTQLETARTDSPAITNLTVGAPSYLQAALIPVLAGVMPDVKLRGVELPASLLRANAEDERFDVLLLPSEPGHLPASWEAEEVGELRKALFGTPELLSSLGPGPISPDALIEIPFVCPVFRREGRIIPMADDCPLPQSRRRVGHEVMTFFVGLEVASATHQLVFGPAIAARRHVQTGALVEIPVAGWDVRDALSFAYHVDRVSAKVRTAFSDALRAAMPRSTSSSGA